MGRGAGKFANEGLKKGTWSSEEDELLIHFVKLHGEGKWRSLAQKAGLKRGGKSCRLRWLNYLRPGIKRGDFSEDEEELIIKLHRLLGNRWVLIAGRLPGRTDNEIKNYWNTILVKKLQGQSQKSDNSKLSSIRQFQSEDKKTGTCGKLQQCTELQARDDYVAFSGGQSSSPSIQIPENDSLISSTKVFDANEYLISDTFNFDSWHENVSEFENGEKVNEPLQDMELKKIASLLDIENELRELL